MDTWTLQKGFPIVSLTRDYNSGEAEVSQERVQTSKGLRARSSVDAFTWWVPLTWTPAGGDFSDTYPKTWLKQGESIAKLTDMPDSNTAVVLNIQVNRELLPAINLFRKLVTTESIMIRGTGTCYPHS